MGSWWSLAGGVGGHKGDHCWAGRGSAVVAERKQKRSLGLGGWAEQLGVPIGGQHAVGAEGLLGGVLEGVLEGVLMSSPAVAVAAAGWAQRGCRGMAAACNPVLHHTGWVCCMLGCHMGNNMTLQH